MFMCNALQYQANILCHICHWFCWELKEVDIAISYMLLSASSQVTFMVSFDSEGKYYLGFIKSIGSAYILLFCDI